MVDKLSTVQKIFDGYEALSLMEDRLSEAGVPDDFTLGHDYYDCSLEIYNLPPDYRLSESAQKIVHEAGFAKCYCNHTDKWETHYSFRPKEDFKISNGWRVSYGFKRGDGSDRTILVEEVVESWPKEWFDTGYCRVQKNGV